LGLAGCIQPPTKLMQQASQAQEDAKTVHAERYAPDQMKVATTAYESAQTTLATQDKKFVLLRNYNTVISQLTEAIAELAKAKTEALKARTTLKVQVRDSMKSANDAVDSAEQTIAKAPLTGAKVDLVGWQDNLAVLRQYLADATAAQNADDLISAKAKLDSAQAAAEALQTTMHDVLGGGHPAAGQGGGAK